MVDEESISYKIKMKKGKKKKRNTTDKKKNIKTEKKNIYTYIYIGMYGKFSLRSKKVRNKFTADPTCSSDKDIHSI